MMENIALHKRVSVKDFSEMQFDDNDDFQYEIINGEMIRKSAPSPVHQEVLKNLLYIIETYNRLQKKGGYFVLRLTFSWTIITSCNQTLFL